ncbi:MULTISPECIES: MmgE/PrpD family protein [unclassified Rhodococcus (in: high G+C Gram-positive bacteria)]|jgi:2-methylcitrate dehydratase PrpD|uniref:MmgE/PrpD family protein n=1 Tax=unclassified Rhodococcus (in: high G+C Gram-positive bacteria) TaxID=192944 RepID=UPI00131F71C6|nr:MULTISPECIES: MmgE/PrpD family protein [unclassified Rhodococcus (in: high G+C Gram-positive bacteria)]QHE70632.1 MmgE/PrpD [Rhodococcus sp. WAY2]
MTGAVQESSVVGMRELTRWAAGIDPTSADLELAQRALIDTVTVTLAALNDPVVAWTDGLPAALRWATVGHVLDFDDLHIPSTTHISVVCVPATLAAGGGAREYLAAAGVMARLGSALGWNHYTQGWHSTATVGAIAAAVAAGLSLGLDSDGVATAMAHAVPAAGGVRQAFGTAGKPMQVGFAADAGVRAARLAAAGATADPRAVDEWFRLVGGRNSPQLSGPLIPDGLGLKLHPCCYALQRPITAIRSLGALPINEIARIRLHTPRSAVLPLIHDYPSTGLEGKFSLNYGIAATLLDGFPDIASFTDAAVQRPEVRSILDRIGLIADPEGNGVLDGNCRVTVEFNDGSLVEAVEELPLGHSRRPVSSEDFEAKVRGCVGEERSGEVMALDWLSAAELLRRCLPGSG